MRERTVGIVGDAKKVAESILAKLSSSAGDHDRKARRDLIATTEKSRELLDVAASYKGNWRDIVLFVCAVLFTIVWWNIPHSRTNWLPTFVFLIILSVIVFFYASRGAIRAVRSMRRHRDDDSTG